MTLAGCGQWRRGQRGRHVEGYGGRVGDRVCGAAHRLTRCSPSSSAVEGCFFRHPPRVCTFSLDNPHNGHGCGPSFLRLKARLCHFPVILGVTCPGSRRTPGLLESKLSLIGDPLRGWCFASFVTVSLPPCPGAGANTSLCTFRKPGTVGETRLTVPKW